MKVCSVCLRCYDDSALSCSEVNHDILTEARAGSCEMVPNYRLEFLHEISAAGETYLAANTILDKPYLITITAPELLDETAEKQFLAETQALSTIIHPNVARVFESGVLADGSLYAVTEFFTAQTLRECLENVGAPSEVTALTITRQAAEGLEALHAVGVSHRAIRPENIILTSDAENKFLVKLQNIDFGGIRQKQVNLNGDRHLSDLRYFSPEQCAAEDADAQTDVYALGVVLYEILAGQVPFDAPYADALIAKQIRETPPEVKIKSFDLRMLLTHTLTDALQKTTRTRLKTANALTRRIRHIEQLATHSSTPPPAMSYPAKMDKAAVVFTPPAKAEKNAAAEKKKALKVSPAAVETGSVIQDLPPIEAEAAVGNITPAEILPAAEIALAAETPAMNDDLPAAEMPAAVEDFTPIEARTVVESLPLIENPPIVEAPVAAEAQAAKENTALTEAETVIEDPVAVEDLPLIEIQTAVDAPPAAELQALVEAAPSAESRTAFEDPSAVENEAIIEHWPVVENEAIIENAVFAETQTATENLSLVENQTAIEELLSAENETAVEIPFAAGIPLRVENEAVAENAAFTEIVTENTAFAENQAIENFPSIENEPLVENAVLAEAETAYESPAAVEVPAETESIVLAGDEPPAVENLFLAENGTAEESRAAQIHTAGKEPALPGRAFDDYSTTKLPPLESVIKNSLPENIVITEISPIFSLKPQAADIHKTSEPVLVDWEQPDDVPTTTAALNTKKKELADTVFVSEGDFINDEDDIFDAGEADSPVDPEFYEPRRDYAAERAVFSYADAAGKSWGLPGKRAVLTGAAIAGLLVLAVGGTFLNRQIQSAGSTEQTAAKSTTNDKILPKSAESERISENEKLSTAKPENLIVNKPVPAAESSDAPELPDYQPREATAPTTSAVTVSQPRSSSSKKRPVAETSGKRENVAQTKVAAIETFDKKGNVKPVPDKKSAVKNQSSTTKTDIFTRPRVVKNQ